MGELFAITIQQTEQLKVVKQRQTDIDNFKISVYYKLYNMEESDGTKIVDEDILVAQGHYNIRNNWAHLNPLEITEHEFKDGTRSEIKIDWKEIEDVYDADSGSVLVEALEERRLELN